jgi:hypothetical protein
MQLVQKPREVVGVSVYEVIHFPCMLCVCVRMRTHAHAHTHTQTHQSQTLAYAHSLKQMWITANIDTKLLLVYK